MKTDEIDTRRTTASGGTEMLAGEFRNKVDSIWETFWTGGITNPLSVIEQITYLLFLKQLDEQQTKQERRARLSGKGIVNLIFKQEDSDIRWSTFKNKTNSQEMFDIVKDKAFPHMKSIGGADSKFARHLDNAVFIIPTPQLLQRVVTAIDKLLEELNERHQDTMGDLYEYLLSKLSTSGTNGQLLISFTSSTRSSTTYVSMVFWTQINYSISHLRTFIMRVYLGCLTRRR